MKEGETLRNDNPDEKQKDKLAGASVDTDGTIYPPNKQPQHPLVIHKGEDRKTQDIKDSTLRGASSPGNNMTNSAYNEQSFA